jgi:hypothetical protein
MLESNENIEEPLLSDDQPSWVTLNASQSEDADLPWDRPEPQPAEPADDLWPRSRPPTTATKESGENNLPKIVLFMRLGNMVAAGLLVFGSVRRAKVAVQSSRLPSSCFVSDATV